MVITLFPSPTLHLEIAKYSYLPTSTAEPCYSTCGLRTSSVVSSRNSLNLDPWEMHVDNKVWEALFCRHRPHLFSEESVTVPSKAVLNICAYIPLATIQMICTLICILKRPELHLPWCPVDIREVRWDDLTIWDRWRGRWADEEVYCLLACFYGQWYLSIPSTV